MLLTTESPLQLPNSSELCGLPYARCPLYLSQGESEPDNVESLGFLWHPGTLPWACPDHRPSSHEAVLSEACVPSDPRDARSVSAVIFEGFNPNVLLCFSQCSCVHPNVSVRCRSQNLFLCSQDVTSPAARLSWMALSLCPTQSKHLPTVPFLAASIHYTAVGELVNEG